MTGLSIMAVGLFCMCAAAPSIPKLLLDVFYLHAVEGPVTVHVSPCARDRALARCVAIGACDGD